MFGVPSGGNNSQILAAGLPPGLLTKPSDQTPSTAAASGLSSIRTPATDSNPGERRPQSSAATLVLIISRSAEFSSRYFAQSGRKTLTWKFTVPSEVSFESCCGILLTKRLRVRQGTTQCASDSRLTNAPLLALVAIPADKKLTQFAVCLN
jgi:hypothetical protein